MNTRHAQIVLTIVREGSITAAAHALFITQPTLSQTLKQIESQLGEPIFVRGRTPLELTRAGELYVQAARRLLQIDAQLDEAISLLHGVTKGTLHLGMPQGRSAELLPQVLSDFYAACPNVRLEVIEGSCEALEDKLIGSELDMALITGDHRRSGLAYRLIATEEIVLLANKQTSLAKRIPSGSTINLAEADSERFVLPSESLPERRFFDEQFELNGLHAFSALICDNVDAAKRACCACPLVMLSPFISLLSDTHSMQRLSHYHLTGDAYLPQFSLVHRSDTPLPPYAEQFFTLASNRFRAMTAYRL